MAVESMIDLAILTEIENSTLTNVAYPNVYYEGKPDFRVNILYNKTSAYGIKTLNRYSGIIQIDVIVKPGIGLPKLNTEIDKVLALFPRNKFIITGNIKINFNKAPIKRNLNVSTRESFIPVDSHYTVIAKEN